MMVSTQFPSSLLYHPNTPMISIFHFVWYVVCARQVYVKLCPDNFVRKEVAKLYGGGCKYKAVWDRMTQINKLGKALKEAYDGGQDPITVEINDNSRVAKPKAEGNGGHSLL